MIRNLLSIPALLTLLTPLPAAEPEWSLRPSADGITLVSPASREVLGYLKTKPAGSALTANSACGIYPLLTPTGDTTVPRAAFNGFCVKGKSGVNAVITTPDGPAKLPSPKHDDPTTGWPDAAWYDYTATLDTGNIAGVSVLSHPSNPPTKWHNPISITMLNPCILMDGDLVLKVNQPLTLRYAVFAHDVAASAQMLDRLAKEFRASTGT